MFMKLGVICNTRFGGWKYGTGTMNITAIKDITREVGKWVGFV